jgi:hypothetical protein
VTCRALARIGCIFLRYRNGELRVTTMMFGKQLLRITKIHVEQSARLGYDAGCRCQWLKDKAVSVTINLSGASGVEDKLPQGQVFL